MSLHVAVSGWLLSLRPSGANRRLLGLLRAIAPLLADGERVTVLHRAAVTPMFVHPQVAWRAVPIPGRPTFCRALAERAVLPRLLRQLQVQVLDHGFLPAPRVPCRLCLTLHDLRDADGEGRRNAWLARAVLRRSLARADAVVVPSAFTASRVRVHVPKPPPLHVLPNGVDLPRGRPPAARARPYLLHTGHLEPRKNLGVLVQALALLVAGGVDAPDLLLAGADAGDGARLRALA
ncbi:MAG TPA: glycosyltransferase, partial [Planctomycetota bacterium]|nr:glycosyltransferase [Planctomycetota bacterium]